MSRRYEELKPITREKAEKVLRSGKADDVVRALLRLALHDPDWRYVQNLCIPYLAAEESSVRGAAATSLGHLARLHRVLDVDFVLPALEPLVEDPAMGGQAQDALDDIRMFLRKG